MYVFILLYNVHVIYFIIIRLLDKKSGKIKKQISKQKKQKKKQKQKQRKLKLTNTQKKHNKKTQHFHYT